MGVSQAELAGHLGNTQTFVSTCERGERRIDAVQLVEFAEALGWSRRSCSVRTLIGTTAASSQMPKRRETEAGQRASCRAKSASSISAFRGDKRLLSHDTRDMSSASSPTSTVLGRHIRSLREELGWSQEKVGVEIGLDESSSRARISRYELGTHEPPVKTARMIAKALGVSLAYLYCDEEEIATLLKKLAARPASQRKALVSRWLRDLEQAG